MLVLSRHRDESLIITAPDGTVIKIMVVAILGDRVRLGTEAPRDWSVHRHEIQGEIDRATGRASAIGGAS